MVTVASDPASDPPLPDQLYEYDHLYEVQARLMRERFMSQPRQLCGVASSSSDSSSYYNGNAPHRRHRRADAMPGVYEWVERAIVTPLGVTLGLDSARRRERLYRATMQAVLDGFVLGRGRHGVVVALSNDPTSPYFRLAVKIVAKRFISSRREPSFHRTAAHALHLQNEVAAMARFSGDGPSPSRSFTVPLYCAIQDDEYVVMVMERACCSLKQLIEHGDDETRAALLAFQDGHALKFLSFCLLISAALLHALWTLHAARIIHHDIHPAQVLVTADGRPRLADFGEVSVLPLGRSKHLVPPLGRRDFCRPPRLGPMQGAEVDAYGCGATLWMAWRGEYDTSGLVRREWNQFEERDALQGRIESLASRALGGPVPRYY